MDTVADKMKKSIDEKNLEIKSEQKITLKIYNLTQSEYDEFIDFVKSKTPNKKGYEAIKILLNSFKSSMKEGVNKNE